jgi:hypothetical protein
MMLERAAAARWNVPAEECKAQNHQVVHSPSKRKLGYGELAALAAQQPLNGAGVRILTESVSSPTLAAQIRDVLAHYPSAKWHQWDPASSENARGGSRLAFGEHVGVQYRLETADVILALGSDFLASGAGKSATRAILRRGAGRNRPIA